MIKMTINNNFIKEIASNPLKAQVKIFRGGQSALQQESKRMVKELKNEMLSSKSGRLYRYNKGFHRASAGGEVLASQGGKQGNLYKSLKSKVKNTLTATFQYRFYAAIWESREKSTKRKFMYNKLLENKNIVANVVANRMASILKFEK